MIDTQERLWTETTSDDQETEMDAQRGGQIPTKLNPKLHHDIQTILTRLVRKAGQLVDNVTTNIAESWMHIRSNFDGGKVVNWSQSGSWEHRCMGAGLQQNMGKQWGPSTWSKMTESYPNQIFTDTAEHSAKKLKRDNERKGTDEVKAKRRKSKYTCNEDDTVAARKAYSRHDGDVLPDEIDDDVSPELLEKLKNGYYETKVVITPEARVIERETIDQSENQQ